MSLSLTCAVVAPALVWAALSDLLYRRISNRLIIALLVLWLVQAGWRLINADIAVRTLLVSAAIAFGVLVIGYALFTMRWMGGGDAKLMAVLCLWLGDQASVFLVVTALAGGVLASVLPLLRMAERGVGHSVMRLNAWLPRSGLPLPEALSGRPAGGMPYGIAIAAGAGFVLWGSR